MKGHDPGTEKTMNGHGFGHDSEIFKESSTDVTRIFPPKKLEDLMSYLWRRFEA